MNAVVEKYESMGEPSPDVKKEFEEKMKPLTSKLASNMMRLGFNPEISKELEEVFDAMDNKKGASDDSRGVIKGSSYSGVPMSKGNLNSGESL